MEINQNFTGIEAKFHELSAKIVEGEGLKLYDLEYIVGSSTLRIFIYNEQTGTAQLDECIRVDRAFSPFAEELEWIPESLTLEVSSPGVYRHLSSIEHFERVVGERIKLALSSPVSDTNHPQAPKEFKGSKKLIGFLREVTPAQIALDIDGAILNISYAEIKKANLEPEI